jgi:hypothetical protein
VGLFAGTGSRNLEAQAFDLSTKLVGLRSLTDLLERMEYPGSPVVADSGLETQPPVLVNRLRVASQDSVQSRSTGDLDSH